MHTIRTIFETTRGMGNERIKRPFE